MPVQPSVVLTERFTRAVDYARVEHAAQVRKGTAIPYLTHLLGVAALIARSSSRSALSSGGNDHVTQ